MMIAFVTPYDARDVSHWSGTPAYMARSLEAAGCRLRLIGGLRERRIAYYKARQVVARVVFRRRHLRDREEVILKGYAAQATARLADGGGASVVLSPSSLPGVFLEGVPVAFWTDATFGSLLGFYREFSRLTRSSIRAGHAAEERALRRTVLAVYSSEWAARDAVERYGADPAKVAVVPFGANLDKTLATSRVPEVVRSRLDGSCRLLFVSNDWERKGGDIALEVANRLVVDGVPAILDIVGAPPSADLPSHAHYLGTMRKEVPSEHERYLQLLGASHFLLLPTRADCTPIVLCEANAYAVPCVTTAVGGVGDIVHEGRNGRAFPVEATAADYATYVADLISRPQQYAELARSAHREYEQRLNWEVAGRHVRDLLLARIS